ncbi:MAG: radical SAM protein [Actinomycetota bacterium]|nr:radical SAM protein [Actinomycetota bacterium]
MTELRWRLADDDGGQGSFFSDDELLDRHVGTGEFRGMEFLHVKARRIINEVPRASRVPFRFTINAYRGCSHACSYCLDGSTAVMTHGGATPLAELRVGDEIYGTSGSGSHRRLERTRVLAHWSTLKQAYRVVLDDGGELLASGDHRLLSDQGWRFVTGAGHGVGRRPHLTTSTALVGPGRSSTEGEAVGTGARRRVRSVEPLGIELPLFDITTGTGDFIANGVVSHNCFARPTHEYLGLGIGEDFDRKVVVKVNAVERLRAELAAPTWGGEHIAMGTNTDPYQRCEGKYHLTQGIIKVLGEAANPFSILTKSTLILRDVTALRLAARRTSVRANLSIGTLDEWVWKATEPGTPHPRRRVEAVARLNQAGIPCGVLVAPVLPGISDAPEQLEAVVTASVEAGAESISAISLHLRPGVREHFLSWLRSTRPKLVDDYERRYRRAYLPGKEQAELADLVAELVRRAGGRSGHPRRNREVSGEAGPKPPARPAPAAPAQLELGLGRTPVRLSPARR